MYSDCSFVCVWWHVPAVSFNVASRSTINHTGKRRHCCKGMHSPIHTQLETWISGRFYCFTWYIRENHTTNVMQDATPIASTKTRSLRLAGSWQQAHNVIASTPIEASLKIGRKTSALHTGHLPLVPASTLACIHWATQCRWNLFANHFHVSTRHPCRYPRPTVYQIEWCKV